MFTKHDIQKLSEIAALPKLSDKNILFPLLSKQERQQIIRTSLVDEERYIAAAIEIQKVWRGYRTRALLFSILQPVSECASSYLSSHYTSSPAFSEIRESLNSSRLSDRVRSSLSRPLSRIEMSYQRYTEQSILKMDHETLLTFQEFCAFTIQSWWRDIMHRLNLYLKLVPVPLKPKKPHVVLTKFEAASIIQRSWRRHIDLQVFKYYKELINFRQQGDPRVMLKSINPKECELLDQASGAHVRFRLGGVKFPPTIYYKIFSHINVADVCSFAPRDYTKSKVLPAQLVHHKDKQGLVEKDVDTTDWYRRIENNGWRPVCDRVLKFMNHDVIAYESGQKKIDYKHCKLQRKQDVDVRKKRKKIEWMKKMYAAGMLQAKDTEDEDVKELVDTAARGVFHTVQENGISTIEDWEVDELIQWTRGLNFESYHDDWKEYGTTQIVNVVAQGLQHAEESTLEKIQIENS